jgi:hypothetical protein
MNVQSRSVMRFIAGAIGVTCRLEAKSHSSALCVRLSENPCMQSLTSPEYSASATLNEKDRPELVPKMTLVPMPHSGCWMSPIQLHGPDASTMTISPSISTHCWQLPGGGP